ncbi:alpha/beta hydrolase-fold protein [Haliovirga abyssi]|uniref:AMP-activated protein kinase glycogen-binding domain-containing protein n=1 Tax=Haliovirga abyssi TaxID=2996794 RepID=A0AAU9DUA2_9FUSO|nr:alpha/beta hydrolase-fold protein [Haliovirga abyssi]BDU49501.1 hypothetical protein HLVA_00700 [Haliovirga abyssi]
MKKNLNLVTGLVLVLMAFGCSNVKKQAITKEKKAPKVKKVITQKVDLKKYRIDNIEGMKFDDFVKILKGSEIKNRQNIVDANFDLLLKSNSFPIIKGELVTFVYKGKTNKVDVTGDFTNNFSGKIPLEKIKGTNLFYKTIKIYINSAVEYKFVVNGSYVNDKLNPNVSNNSYKNSRLLMPEYQLVSERKNRDNIKKGTIVKEIFENKSLISDKNLKRRVQIYLPYNYTEGKKYKVIYFTDGKEYLKDGNAKNILDNMIFDGEIEPVIGVFVDSIERESEYIYNTRDEYIKYFVENMMPKIENKYSVSKNRNDRILVGDSFGGDFVVYLSYKYSDKFKNVICQSGNLMSLYAKGFNSATTVGKFATKESIYNEISQNSNYPVKMFITYGDYEIIGKNSKVLYNLLKKNKTVDSVKLVSYPQGHGFSLWGDTLKEGLIWIINNKNINKKVVEKKEEKKVDVNIEWYTQEKQNKIRDKKKYYFAIGKRSKELFKYSSGDEIVADILNSDRYIELKPEVDNKITIEFPNEDYSKYFIFPFYDINGNGKVDREDILQQSYTKEHILGAGFSYFTIKDWLYYVGLTVFKYEDKVVPFFDYNFIDTEENSWIYIYPFF